MLSLTTMLGSDFVSPSVLELRPDQASVVAAVSGALVVGLSGAVTVQSLRRLIVPTGLLSVGTAAVAARSSAASASAIIAATGVAAVALGAAGRLVAARLGAPSMVLVVPASFALLPGLTIFRGLYELVAASGDAPGSLTIQSGSDHAARGGRHPGRHRDRHGVRRDPRLPMGPDGAGRPAGGAGRRCRLGG